MSKIRDESKTVKKGNVKALQGRLQGVVTAVKAAEADAAQVLEAVSYILSGNTRDARNAQMEARYRGVKLQERLTSGGGGARSLQGE